MLPYFSSMNLPPQPVQLAVQTNFGNHPTQRKPPTAARLPSLAQSGLRSYLEPLSSAETATELGQSLIGAIGQDRCRRCDSVVSISSMPSEDRQSLSTHQSCGRCNWSLRTAAPLDSTCNSPTTLSERLEHLECDSASSIGCPTPSGSSVYSDSSTDRKPKRRRASSPSHNARKPHLKQNKPKTSSDTRKEKKEKEQDARNGQKEQVKEMEDLVTRYWGCEGMTELNQNNSKASGLKYKKVEVYNRAVLLIKRLVRENSELRRQMQ